MFILSFLYFLRLSCSHSSHSLRHHSAPFHLPFLSESYPFFRVLQLGIQFSLHPAPSLFGIQQQLTHTPVKSSTLPLRRMLVFHDIASWYTIVTSSCVISLWDSATVHSPYGKELNPFSQKVSRFPGRCALAYKFHFMLHHPSLGLSNSSLTPR